MKRKFHESVAQQKLATASISPSNLCSTYFFFSPFVLCCTIRRVKTGFHLGFEIENAVDMNREKWALHVVMSTSRSGHLVKQAEIFVQTFKSFCDSRRKL